MKWSVVQKTEWASVLSMCPTALLALYLYLPRTVFIITIGNYSPNPGNTMRRALLRGSPARSLGTLKPAWAPWGPQQIPARQEIKIFSDPTKPWFLGPVAQYYATQFALACHSFQSGFLLPYNFTACNLPKTYSLPPPAYPAYWIHLKRKGDLKLKSWIFHLKKRHRARSDQRILIFWNIMTYLNLALVIAQWLGNLQIMSIQSSLLHTFHPRTIRTWISEIFVLIVHTASILKP